MMISAAVLAEVCSALPLSGSIYIWAAESAGPKYARFFGFIVAWWSCTAWMTFTAGNSQVSTYHLCFVTPSSSDPYSLNIRQLQIMSFHSLPSGRLTFLEGSLTTISNGVLSFGPSRKACLLSRWQLITFLRNFIRPSFVFRS